MKPLAYAQAHRERFLDELKEFLSIPSVSTQAQHKPDVALAAGWLRGKLLEAGFPKAEVMPTQCTGCTTCADVCHTGAISFVGAGQARPELPVTNRPLPDTAISDSEM